jgi:hypothetical protein
VEVHTLRRLLQLAYRLLYMIIYHYFPPLLRFSLRLARVLFPDHYYFYFYFSEPDLSDFVDVQHPEYATDPLETYTIVMVERSTLE